VFFEFWKSDKDGIYYHDSKEVSWWLLRFEDGESRVKMALASLDSFVFVYKIFVNSLQL